jgi:maltoporin
MYLFSKEDTFAAIQGMVMYVIMRMANREATENDTALDMYTIMVRPAYEFKNPIKPIKITNLIK